MVASSIGRKRGFHPRKTSSTLVVTTNYIKGKNEMSKVWDYIVAFICGCMIAYYKKIE